MTKFLIIRHGQSRANLERVFAGHFNAPLTDLGVLQAKRTAEYIRDNYKVDKIYASDLSRAFETGKALSDLLGLPITPTPELREIFAGKWEGVPLIAIKETFPEDYQTWISDMPSCRCTEGESVKELGDRVFSCFKRLAEENPDSTVAVATHATPIRALQSIIANGDVSGVQELGWVTNASVTTVIYDNGKWSLIEASHDGHLAEFVTAIPKII